MNIKELAKQAGFIVDNDSEKYQTQCIQATHSLIDEPLAKFAALVAAHEREECAKVCEEDDGAGLANEHWWECADAIRARSAND